MTDKQLQRQNRSRFFIKVVSLVVGLLFMGVVIAGGSQAKDGTVFGWIVSIGLFCIAGFVATSLWSYLGK